MRAASATSCVIQYRLGIDAIGGRKEDRKKTTSRPVPTIAGSRDGTNRNSRTTQGAIADLRSEGTIGLAREAASSRDRELPDCTLAMCSSPRSKSPCAPYTIGDGRPTADVVHA